MENNNSLESRPWGYFETLSDAPDHKIKRITINPGKRISLQRHRHRAEHWFFIQGTGIVTCNKEIIHVKKQSAIDIAKNALHRIENTGNEDLIFIEIQYGEYFGEDDIERIEDDFGRE